MGVSTGAAMNGMRPVFMHNRPDFVLLAFNQLVTHAVEVSLHGQRPDDRADGGLGGDRPRLGIGRAAFAGDSRHAARRAGPEDRDAEHAVRRQGPAAVGDPRQQPGVRVRASLADEEGRRRARGRLPRADRQGHLPAPRPRRHDRRRVARDRAGVAGGRRCSRRRASTPRSSTCARSSRSTRRSCSSR